MSCLPPRIVIVLHAFVPESFGGAEQHTRRLARALCRRDAHVTIIAPRLRPDTMASECNDGVCILRVALRHAPNLGGRRLVSFLRWCSFLAAWLWRNRNSFDVVHVVHGRLHAVPAVVVSRLLGKPAVVKPGRGGAEYFDLNVVRKKKLIGPLLAWLVRKCTTAWIANSRQIEADLLAAGIRREKIAVIPNGVEIPDPEALPQHANHAVVFAYWGRLDREKNLEQLIDVFARLPENAGARLVIVGDGECRAGLERKICELNQQSRIAVVPPMHDIMPLLSEADFHVSTSLSEGMSNALLEAMSFAIPPLVSRVSGVEELITDGTTGLTFVPGDSAAFEHKLHEALLMPGEQRRAMGLKAYDRVRTRFAMPLIAEQHLEFYRKLAAT